MAESLPSSASKANCDATTDNPQQALLTDLAGLVDKFNELLGVIQPAALAKFGVGSNPFGGGITVIDNGPGVADNLVTQIYPNLRSGDVANQSVGGLARANYFSGLSANASYALTAASTYGVGWWTMVVNATTSYTVTINPDGSETINGRSSYTLQPGEAAILACTGSEWVMLGGGLTTDTRIGWLSNVNAPSPTDGQALVWSSASSKWVNATINSGSQVQAFTGLTSSVACGNGLANSSAITQSETITIPTKGLLVIRQLSCRLSEGTGGASYDAYLAIKIGSTWYDLKGSDGVTTRNSTKAPFGLFNSLRHYDLHLNQALVIDSNVAELSMPTGSQTVLIGIYSDGSAGANQELCRCDIVQPTVVMEVLDGS